MNQLTAIIKLVISWIAATGAQMRSILLGVIVFIIVPIPENATTNQIPVAETGNNRGNTNPALDNTIIARTDNINRFTMATILIFGGYLPGNFPPIEAEPHGIPIARPNWKRITITVKTVKIIADGIWIIKKSSD